MEKSAEQINRRGIMKGAAKPKNHGREVDSESSTKKKNKHGKRSRLVKFEELPEYMQDNEYIRDYYRCEWPLRDIVFSIFAWHNETLNIWTHLVGFMIFGTLTAVSLMEKETVENLLARFSLIRPAVEGPLMMMILNKGNGSDDLFIPDSNFQRQNPIAKTASVVVKEETEKVPGWPWFVFLGGAMGCLVFSTLSHLFASHSKRFHFFFWRLDYSGIALMIVCSFFTPIYYTFSCHPYCRLLYLSAITFVGICAIFTLLSPALSAARFRSFRAKLFLAMGFSGVIPAAHGLILYFDHPKIIVALGYEIAMGVLYALGAAFYITRIPEKWRPGAFDIVGQSHQIFHTFVVAAALAHCFATLEIMDWRRGLPAAACTAST